MARRHCIRRKLVRMKGGRMVKRCAKYAKGARKSTYRRRGKKSGSYRRRGKSRKPAGMARRGSTCRRWKKVRVKGQGMAWRCAGYTGGRKAARKRRTYRRKGR